MMDPADELKLTYEAGLVTRWHNLPMVGQQTDAAHQWGVLQVVLTLWDSAVPPSFALIRACVSHDVVERYSGDIPSPARRDEWALQAGEDNMQARVWAVIGKTVPDEDLSDREAAWLLFADMAEAFLWCCHQRRLGNTCVIGAQKRILQSLEEHLAATADEFLDHEGLLDCLKRTGTTTRHPEYLSLMEEKHL